MEWRKGHAYLCVWMDECIEVYPTKPISGYGYGYGDE